MCKKSERAVSWAINIANDNSHGYSQSVRWGDSYDCSSLVIQAFENAGVPVKTLGATYTGNMYPIFLRAGFKDVTDLVNRVTAHGMKRGDVLLNVANHTALYIGNNMIVHARSSEGTSDTRDNSGNEIRTQAYWNYPWDYVLRLEEDESDLDGSPARRSHFCLQKGDGMGHPLPRVKSWQGFLCEWGFPTETDGEYGPDTERQTVAWQEYAKSIGRDVEVNGIVDADDWEEVILVEI